MTKIQGDSDVVVLTVGDRIAASMTFTSRNEPWFGKRGSVLHTGDLRVSSDFRSMGLARRIIEQWFEELLRRDVLGGGFEIIHDNLDALALIKLIDQHPHLDYLSLGSARIFQVLNLAKHRVDSQYSYRQAVKEDAAALSELLLSGYGQFNGCPDFSKAALLDLMSQHPSFSWEDMWIAEKDGHPLACIGFWDQQSIRRTVVQTFSPSIQIAAATLRMVRPLTGLPSIPRPGQPLSYGFIRFPAHGKGEQAALNALTRHLLNRLRRMRKYQFIWFSFHEKDRMQFVLNGLVKKSMQIKLFFCLPTETKAKWSEESQGDRIPYVDFSLV